MPIAAGLPLGMGRLGRAVELCLWSAYVKEEKPLSLLIIGLPESGKTLVMDLFRQNQGVISAAMITRIALIRKLNEYHELHRSYPRHIFFRDLANMLQSNSAVVSDLLSVLTPLLEEGLDEVQTYEIHKAFDPPLKVGAIAAVTPGVMKRRQLKDVGFYTRFIPLFHRYDKSVVSGILDSIASGRNHPPQVIQKLPPETSPPVQVSCPADYVKRFSAHIGYDDKGNRIEPLDDSTGKFGFRQLRDVRILLKACALSHGHQTVTDEDLGEVLDLMAYIKLSYGAYLDEFQRSKVERIPPVIDGFDGGEGW